VAEWSELSLRAFEVIVAAGEGDFVALADARNDRRPRAEAWAERGGSREGRKKKSGEKGRREVPCALQRTRIGEGLEKWRSSSEHKRNRPFRCVSGIGHRFSKIWGRGSIPFRDSIAASMTLEALYAVCDTE
jgi:hypothetical protein